MQSNVRMKKFDGLKKFKKDPKYVHNRSEGLTWRTNAGSRFQMPTKRPDLWVADHMRTKA